VGGIIRLLVLQHSMRNRKNKAASIAKFMQDHNTRSLVLCGAVGESSHELRNEGIVERLIANRAETVVGFDILMRTAQPWPFLVADGRTMPFRDKSCDLMVSNAVIEHVGNEGEQRRMVDEFVRVSRTWILTTPNRWFPVESHTSTAFVHWVPAWRRQRQEFSRLLSRREFRALLPADARIEGKIWSTTFTAFWSEPTDSAAGRS
jgi:hypothetical protein